MFPCRRFAVLPLFFCCMHLAADPLPPDLLDHLPAHPRLHADAARWEELRTQIETDPASGRLYAALLQEADADLPRPVVVYKKEGRRLLEPVREGRNRILALAAAARLSGDDRYRERAVAEMQALAALPNWNPSHFLDTAEATAGLATGYDWLYDRLTPADRKSCEDAILQKGLRTSFDAPAADLGWVKGTNNWNQVCHGGLTLGALAVAERDPALARRVIARAAANLHFAAHAYAPAGVYPEGPMYWGYGTLYQVLLVDALRSTLGRTLDLEKFPGFLESVDFYQEMIAPSGRFFNYSDCVEKPPFAPPIFWFARELHRPDLWRGQMGLLPAPPAPPGTYGPPPPPPRDLYALALLWRQPEADEAAAPAPRAPRWLGDGPVPVATLRSALDDPKAVFVGFKAGSPSANHAHMDVGSFVLEADGVRWAVDPGMQDYYSLESKGVDLWNIHGQRWDVFRIGPDAHNILRFDGARQRLAAHARFDRSRLDGPDPFVIADLGTVYAGKAVGVRRGVCLRDDRRVVIQDEWTAGGAPVQAAWQWLTRAEVTPDAHGATLRQDGHSLRLRVVAPGEFTVGVEDASQPVHAYDAPNPRLKRIVVRTSSAAGAPGQITVLAEPESAVGALPEGWAARPLGDW